MHFLFFSPLVFHFYISSAGLSGGSPGLIKVNKIYPQSSISVGERNHCVSLAGLPVACIEFHKSISTLFFLTSEIPDKGERQKVNRTESAVLYYG